MQSIAVIDYGMGNLRSVAKAFEFLLAGKRHRVCVTSNAQQITRASRVVFPGQGAAGDCMRALDESGLRDTVLKVIAERPFLGICMGMGVLVESSDENQGTDCLGVFPGRLRSFGGRPEVAGCRLKVPHMGWNQVTQKGAHPLWQGIEDRSRFYFVHSYYLENTALTVGECDYGGHFSAAVAQDNVFALQCHPEKSATDGLRLLSNFLHWDGQA